MLWAQRFWLRLQTLFRRQRIAQRLNDEIQFHLDQQIAENVAAGMSREEARYAAMRGFGNTTFVKEETRDTWGWTWLEDLAADLRFGARMLRKTPGFTLVAVGTLALGIGVNAAIFTVVHAVLLRSLPAANPSQLYRLGDNDNCCVWGGFQNDFGIFSYPLYRNLRDQTPEFEQMAAFEAYPVPFGARRTGSSASAESLVGEFVSANYFSTFGVPAYAGRTLVPSDDEPGASPVVVISYRAWKDRYGLDPSIIGGSLTINGAPFTVAGVAPPGFYGETLRSDPPDLFIALSQEPIIGAQRSLLGHAELHWLYIIGRLRGGEQPSQLEAKLLVQLRQWLTAGAGGSSFYAKSSDIARVKFRLSPGGAGVTTLRDRYLRALQLLVVVAALVLIIACANIANLLLARATANRQQTALRQAVGASRLRLMRQTLTESVLLSVIGGGVGLLVAVVGTGAILSLAFQGSKYVPISASPSLPVLGFAFLISLLTGIAFGVAPGWAASRLDPAEVLRGASRSTRDRAGLPRRSLVVLQSAVSVVLLVGAGLLIRSLANLEGQQFGFETQGRLIASVNPSLAGYTPERLPVLYREIQERLMELPGVVSVSYSLDSPMQGNRWTNDVCFEDGRTRAKAAGEEDYAVWNRIGPRYFETIGTPIVRGRSVEEQDTPTARRVAVVNETFARRYYKNEDPIGKYIGKGGGQYRGEYEIVGVVRDAKYNNNARFAVEPMVFLPFFQNVEYKEPQLAAGEIRTNFIEDVELRVTSGPESVAPLLRRAMADIDPNLPITEIRTLSEQVERNFNQERLVARLTGLFGLLALVLACVGLYGVTAYGVAQRRSEIGIRIALGAQRGQVLRLMLAHGLRPAALGLALGLGAGVVATKIIRDLLYGVQPLDTSVFAAVATILLAVAGAACLLPAWRASRLEPTQALRSE
jgi:predicted permease